MISNILLKTLCQQGGFLFAIFVQRHVNWNQGFLAYVNPPPTLCWLTFQIDLEDNSTKNILRFLEFSSVESFLFLSLIIPILKVSHF